MVHPVVLIPALNAAETVGGVVQGLKDEIGDLVPIIVVDDGSTDATAALAEKAGARVVRHSTNRGKGAAIRTGLVAARDQGCDVALTVDADGQHASKDAARLLDPAYAPEALVLGTRDLASSGAPRGNLIGNHASNFFVSIFTWRRFRDTQCGLRRYPIEKTLSVRTRDQRFGFEAEVIFAAMRAGIPVVEAPVVVLYPPRHKHTTHYRAFKDTVHIVLRITATILYPVRWPLAVIGLIVILYGLHSAIVYGTRMTPPAVAVPPASVQVDPTDGDLRRVAGDYARHRGKIWEVSLSGSPEELGAHEVALLRSEMVANEGVLWNRLDTLVRWSFAQFLIFDIARLRFRNVDRLISDRHRREIAAAASMFAPDPFSARIPAYQRMVYLNSLYDVSLSFEHSPLIGCTSFALTGEAAEGGHSVLARTFDFEAGDIFDAHKAVFLVHESGRLAYASVAWPGLIGAVTGMNEAGLALVVHGGRAREARNSGEPLAHTMRDVLGEARTTDDAVRVLASRQAMVSHIVMLVDAAGNVAVVERAPGEPSNVRRGSTKTALTNHFEGPWADDPANLQVKAETSTLARRARANELLSRLPPGAGVEDLVALLRDKRGVGDVVLPAGDRRAIDAHIATHGVVMDTTARVIWVSEGPHLAGRFIRFDIGRLLAPGYDPRADHDVVASSADDADQRTGAATSGGR